MRIDPFEHKVGTMTDEKLNKILDRQFAKFYAHMQTHFDDINVRLDQKADKDQLDRVLNTLDGIVARLDTHVDEQTVTNHRHQSWITQLAKKTHTKLAPEV